MPFFDWTTNCFDGRFCEEDYAEKLMHFINFIHHDLPDEIYMNCLYSSNTDHLSKSRILLVVSFRLRTEFSKWKSKHTSIKKLKEVGNRIDTIISSENDYYKLDYLMNAMYKDNSYNQNHFFKTFSLIEMILMRDKHRNLNIDSLLIPFLKSDYDNDSELLAKLLRQMRNKIAHGDFQGFNKKAEEYAQKFMVRYQFDYSEYSRLNWILLNTCCLLDDLLRKVLLKQLKYNLQF